MCGSFCSDMKQIQHTDTVRFPLKEQTNCVIKAVWGLISKVWLQHKQGSHLVGQLRDCNGHSDWFNIVPSDNGSVDRFLLSQEGAIIDSLAPLFLVSMVTLMQPKDTYTPHTHPFTYSLFLSPPLYPSLTIFVGFRINLASQSGMGNLDLSVRVHWGRNHVGFKHHTAENGPGLDIRGSVQLQKLNNITNQYTNTLSGNMLNNWTHWHTDTHEVKRNGWEVPLFATRGRFCCHFFVLCSQLHKHTFTHWRTELSEAARAV